MTRSRLVLAAGLVLWAGVLAGCAARLVPAPGAQVVPGPGEGAVAREAGVQVSASVDAWRGRPSSLPAMVTPVLVTVDNHGTVPVRIQRDSFALVAEDGTRLLARTPQEIDGFVVERAPTAAVYPRFSIGAGFGRYRGWGYGLGPVFSDHYYYPVDVWVRLPTADMVAMALPETVLEPGASASGFLYFHRVKRGVKRLDFTAKLASPTGQPVATVTIPFVVE